MTVVRSLLTEAIVALSNHSGWIAWNLFLAVIPWLLSLWLFRRSSHSLAQDSRSVGWWVGFLVFAAFLPNAPYLLTDAIHLIEGIRAHYTIWTTTLVLIPVHSLAIFAGFQAYVLSVLNVSFYLQRQGASRWIAVAELITHLLSACGIYLGRFQRFNSWDFVAQPDELLIRILDDFTSKRPLAIVAVTFVILTVLYWLGKQVTLGVMLRWRYGSLERLVMERHSIQLPQE